MFAPSAAHSLKTRMARPALFAFQPTCPALSAAFPPRPAAPTPPLAVKAGDAQCWYRSSYGKPAADPLGGACYGELPHPRFFGGLPARAPGGAHYLD